jgi:hypothetical protein
MMHAKRLPTVCTLLAANLPKLFSLSPDSPAANGMIKQELYYELLVIAHDHEHMANIRSFAIFSISDLNAPILAQENTDTNSLVQTTLKQLILTSKVHGTKTELFSSIELTSILVRQMDGITNY